MEALTGVVLAHQGGWDEVLFVAVPMAVLVGLLRLAQKRAAKEEDAEGVAAGSEGVAAGGDAAVPGPEPDGR